MRTRRRTLSYLLAFIPAVLLAGVLGSVIQTQFNLLAIGSIGPAIDFTTRLETTIYDLRHFGPVYTAIIFLVYLIALPVAHLVVRVQKRQIYAWCAVATAIGLWVAFRFIDHFAPMPTLIAATRTTPGTLLMIFSSFLGGLFYAWLSRILRRYLPHTRKGT